MLPPTALRVRQVTADDANLDIDVATLDRLEVYAQCPEMIDRRLKELDREWDIERALATSASSLTLLGIMKARHSLKWLGLTIIVAGFLLQHALQGWCPPLALFRRMGIRTQREIDNERTILKLIRGDYDDVMSEEEADIEELFEVTRQSPVREA